MNSVHLSKINQTPSHQMTHRSQVMTLRSGRKIYYKPKAPPKPTLAKLLHTIQVTTPPAANSHSVLSLVKLPHTTIRVTTPPAANSHSVPFPPLPAYSHTQWPPLVSIINDRFSGVMLRSPATLEHSLGTITVWPNGDTILLTDEEVGRGLTKAVYIAHNLRNGTRYAAAFMDSREIEIQETLKNRRGIAQLYNHMNGTFKGRNHFFACCELYDTDLSKRISHCTLEDLQVIVKDLIYAIIALEGDDPKGDWIQHNDVKDANVFVKIDQASGRVLGAYLGDFGTAGVAKTTEINEETAQMEMERYGCLFHPHREPQREKFISTVFHQIKNYLNKDLRKNISLKTLCAGDPVCEKLMEQMETRYSDILAGRYFHWVD